MPPRLYALILAAVLAAGGLTVAALWLLPGTAALLPLLALAFAAARLLAGRR